MEEKKLIVSGDIKVTVDDLNNIDVLYMDEEVDMFYPFETIINVNTEGFYDNKGDLPELRNKIYDYCFSKFKNTKEHQLLNEFNYTLDIINVRVYEIH